MVVDTVAEWTLLFTVIASVILTSWALYDAWIDLMVVIRDSTEQRISMLRLAWGAVRGEGVRLVIMVCYLYISLELLGFTIIAGDVRRSVLVSVFTVTVLLQALKLFTMRRDRRRILRDNGNNSVRYNE